MKILFLTIGGFDHVSKSGIYTDLLRKFVTQNHEVYVVCSKEKRLNSPTSYQEECGIHVLRVQTGNITKTRMLEKGLSTLLIKYQYINAMKKYLQYITFDMILYSTPPITMAGVVYYLKRECKTFTYLMLKDIFPQNAVDLEILKTTGARGLIYRYFRTQEKKLYEYSDKIGCMSEKNMEYLTFNNPEIKKEKIELCPNTIDLITDIEIDRNNIRMEYGIPDNKLVLIYGGNFGKPQDVNYIVNVLVICKREPKFHFVMCGSGTDFHKIKNTVIKYELENVTIIDFLPADQYRKLISACDIGLIFLDHRFTIPNIPSRILDYMNCSCPVFAATDSYTDLKNIILEGGFGWWVESSDITIFKETLLNIKMNLENNSHYLKNKGDNAKRYLANNFITDVAYKILMTAYDEYEGERICLQEKHC